MARLQEGMMARLHAKGAQGYHYELIIAKMGRVYQKRITQLKDRSASLARKLAVVECRLHEAEALLESEGRSPLGSP